MLRGPASWTLLAVLSALPGLLGCRGAAVGPGDERCPGAVDSLLTLCVGQEVRAPDGGVARIAFLGVRSDSRCPRDVECVWAGNAGVAIGVAFGMGPTVPYVLDTGVEPRTAAFGTFRLMVADLQPVPVSPGGIPGDQYIVTLRFERVWVPD